MHKFSLILGLLINFLLPASVISQSLTNIQRRIVNEALLELFRNYETYSRLTTDNKSINENYVMALGDIFSENALIYLDILPSNKVGESVSYSKYIHISKKYFSEGIGIKIHNLLFDVPEFVNKDDFTVHVELSKEIYGHSKSKVNYRDTIPLNFTVGFSISRNQVTDMKILDVTGKPRGRFLKIKVLRFITHKPIESAVIKLDTSILKTDINGGAFFLDIDPDIDHTLLIYHECYLPYTLTGFNIDHVIEGITEDSHKKLRYDYFDPNELIYFLKSLSFSVVSVSPVFSFSLPDYKTLVSENQFEDGNTHNVSVKGNFSSRIGFLVELALYRSKIVDFSLYSGLENCFFKTTYSFDRVNYTDFTYIDDLKQEIGLSLLSLPLLLSIHCRLFKGFELAGTFGLSPYIINNISSTVDYTIRSRSDNDLVAGNSRIPEKKSMACDRSDLSYRLSLSLGKKISPSLKLFAGATYNYFDKPLCQNIKQASMITEDRKINNVLNIYETTRLQYFGLEFGLTYNFYTLKY